MITDLTRSTLVALATTAALLPAVPALAQTATPTVAIGPTTPAPAAPRIDVDRRLIDYGQTTTLVVFGRVGATVQLFGNGRVIRTAVLELTEQDAIGTAVFPLQPGDRTLFYAVVDGQQTASATVEVRRTVTIGISQANGIYTFSGQVARAEAGLQVTIARLDDQTKRVTGVASTRTDAAGRYVIRTALPQGLAGYYALTGVTPTGALQPGRSRLYGLLVNTRPTPPQVAQGLSLSVAALGNRNYAFQGEHIPARGGVQVTLARIVDGRLVGVASDTTSSTGRYLISVQLAPGTYQFTTLSPTGARSRNYGLVVPAARVAQPGPVAPTTATTAPADVDCGDFRTQRDAQAFFDRYVDQFGDFADLDADNDGRACESLP